MVLCQPSEKAQLPKLPQELRLRQGVRQDEEGRRLQGHSRRVGLRLGRVGLHRVGLVERSFPRFDDCDSHFINIKIFIVELQNCEIKINFFRT